METENVIADLHYYNSNAKNYADVTQSTSQCNRLRQSQMINPYTNKSQSFPNHILCESINDNITLGNVEVVFLYFARNADVANNILQAYNNSDSANGIEVIDVSGDSRKVWDWIYYLNDIRLYGFDYVWMIDGDILLRSINWVAFWQQILLLRPKIAQPSIIGTTEGGYSSYHSVLRHQQDSRLFGCRKFNY